MRTLAFYTHPYETSSQMSAFVIHSMAFFLLAAAVPEASDHYGALGYWTLMTMIGSLGASLMAFMLNRVAENPRAVTGRVIGAIVSGVCLPRVLTYAHPKVLEFTHDPLLLVAFGFLCALGGYAGAAALVEKFMKEAPSAVDRQVDRLAEKISSRVVDKSVAALDQQTILITESMVATALTAKSEPPSKL